MTPIDSTHPKVVLEPISKDQTPVLQNLYELYAHDFSEHVPLDIQPSGRFEVSFGNQWWASEGHHPFFIRSEGKLCGFALVQKGSRITEATDVMDVAEFFVVRGARQRGVGLGAAHALLHAFPGRWEIRIRRSNPAALRFWTRAVERWVKRPVTLAVFSAKGVDWDVLRVDASAVRAKAT